jgi:hypothetical protein
MSKPTLFLAVGTVFALAGCDAACGTATNRAPASSPSPADSLTLSAPVEQVGKMPAREPMIVEHPNGTLFVTGYGAPTPHLWRSADGGATWTPVNVGTEADGAVGNSDVDLAVAPDGTLYFIVMSYDRKTDEGTQVAIGASRDAGATWKWTQLSKTRYDDRPWVEVTSDNTAHAIWNDGSGVSYARSADGGRTWQEQPRIHPQGHSSHMAVGPSGEIAVRITPVSASMNVEHPGVELVAVSIDGGNTWTKLPAPGTRTFTFPYSEAEDPMPRWVEPVAWDSVGHLYYLWTDPAALWLARSTDRGATWTTWKLAEGGNLRYFPYLTARGKGELAATWYSGRDESLRAHIARIDVSDPSTAPRVLEAPTVQPDTWGSGTKPGEPRKRDTAGEYVPVMFLKDGGLAVVTTIQDPPTRGGFAFRTAR